MCNLLNIKVWGCVFQQDLNNVKKTFEHWQSRDERLKTQSNFQSLSKGCRSRMSNFCCRMIKQKLHGTETRVQICFWNYNKFFLILFILISHWSTTLLCLNLTWCITYGYLYIYFCIYAMNLLKYLNSSRNAKTIFLAHLPIGDYFYVVCRKPSWWSVSIKKRFLNFLPKHSTFFLLWCSIFKMERLEE